MHQILDLGNKALAFDLVLLGLYFLFRLNVLSHVLFAHVAPGKVVGQIPAFG